MYADYMVARIGFEPPFLVGSAVFVIPKSGKEKSVIIEQV
jgi:hypothetical protein